MKLVSLQTEHQLDLHPVIVEDIREYINIARTVFLTQQTIMILFLYTHEERKMCVSSKKNLLKLVLH